MKDENRCNTNKRPNFIFLSSSFAALGHPIMVKIQS